LGEPALSEMKHEFLAQSFDHLFVHHKYDIPTLLLIEWGMPEADTRKAIDEGRVQINGVKLVEYHFKFPTGGDGSVRIDFKLKEPVTYIQNTITIAGPKRSPGGQLVL
jgi:hypothetical protein